MYIAKFDIDNNSSELLVNNIYVIYFILMNKQESQV